MRLNLHVRGDALLGGVQKLRGVDVGSLCDLVSVLERELRPLQHTDCVLIDSLRYHDAEFGDYVLLEDIDDLPPDRARLEIVGPAPPPAPADRRPVQVVAAVDAHGLGAAAAAEREREVRRLREDRAALRQELEMLRRELEAGDEQRLRLLRSVSAFVRLLQVMVPAAERGGKADVQRVVDVYRRLSPSQPLFGQLREEDATAADEILRRVMQVPPSQGSLRLSGVLGDALSDVATAILDRAGAPSPADADGTDAGSPPHQAGAAERWASPPPAASSDHALELASVKVSDERVVYVQMSDSKRLKVVQVDLAEPAPFLSLQKQLEAKCASEAGSLRLAYCDDDGFSWEVDDDESFREFLSRFPPGLDGERRRAQLTCYNLQPLTAPPSLPRQLIVDDGRDAVLAQDVSGAMLSDEQWRAKWTEYLDRYDVSCSGTLKRKELCTLLREEATLGWLDDTSLLAAPEATQGTFLERKIDSILLQLDAEHDGSITYDEFCLIMLKLSQV
eukprot:TRINITY_DN3167_c0_g1_i1.p1 TRINITY_DN3167_c0_g1~~TRINITY_DN3167_c0_g1_i1.p1  ORF type:complete len:521 (+),score=245.27 TRINITY_DN3167_c0_g1_i1:49-1563(+)